MARQRLIESSEYVYVGPSPSTGCFYSSGGAGIGFTGAGSVGVTNLVHQLQRVQSANYSWDVARKFVSQYGQLSPLDQVILEAPTVPLALDWLAVDCTNTYNL